MAEQKQQLSIVGLKTQAEAQQEAKEIAERRQARNVLRTQLMAALRNFCKGQTDVVAAELDKDGVAFGYGKGVSGSLLNACLRNSERNYFRLDWLLWFAEQSDEVAEVLLEIAGRGKPKKKPEDELRDLKELMRKKLGSVANEIIRKAES